ncbi:uncharacterized protein FFE2_06403 [Fusarium fujikuroi]|nr:uncharacterized protein FFC1_02304 [Fusarium fujikuroi]SCN87409.1 uncharacterized protein FFE2_06403 [Fusarium fujikuroi]SCV41547.1 uncharacterized protein FFFS_06388 [Fusarium fujikuroi]
MAYFRQQQSLRIRAFLTIGQCDSNLGP